jgi:hypothetical protein
MHSGHRQPVFTPVMVLSIQIQPSAFGSRELR